MASRASHVGSSGRPLVISPAGEVCGALDANESHKVLSCFNMGPRAIATVTRGAYGYVPIPMMCPYLLGTEMRAGRMGFLSMSEPSRGAKADSEKHDEAIERPSSEQEEAESGFERDAAVEDGASDDDSAILDVEA